MRYEIRDELKDKKSTTVTKQQLQLHVHVHVHALHMNI